ncbi:MAG: GTPase, partial [Acidimicrobiia bacterium]
MSDLREILDLHDRLVAACVGVVPEDAVEAAAEVGRAARRRVGYLGDTVLVALAGGTGSGKSSLLNALAGEEVSAPGAMRPTTAEPVAWIPSNPEPGLTRLLDDLGIDIRIGQDLHPWLAVLDLPDIDSVVIDHRLRVERLLPLVDSVVWVVDPEKYQDARLHRDHLAPLAAHADRFVFALNQIDRVGTGEVAILAGDLRRSLHEDGIRDAAIVLTAGDPPTGPPRGLDELLGAIRSLGSTAEVVARRVVDQLVTSADQIVAPLGGAAGTGFVAQWTGVRNEVAADVSRAVEADLRREANAVAADDARAVTAWLRSRRPASAITASGAHLVIGGARPVLGLVERVSESLDARSRMALFDTARTIEDNVTAVARTVGATTTVPLADAPAWWSKVRVLSYVCAVA